MVELSDGTRKHLLALFRPEDAAEAERLLARDCAETLPLVGQPSTPGSLERLRFAALRLSGGDLSRLREAIGLAQIDWRDLLVAAEFGRDVDAHTRWQPRRFDARVADRWKAGDVPAGVAFVLDDAVNVLAGARRSGKGAIVALRGLEPEPRYLVRLDSGGEIEAFERNLRRQPS